jgi:fructose-1,6-bisphosphatase I
MQPEQMILPALPVPAPLQDVMERLCRTGADLARTIARGGISHNLGEASGVNSGGDQQKMLDVLADEAFMAALRGSAVRFYASEEQDEAVELTPDGSLALAIDPLDGSSNIDVNVSIGTIFSIYPVAETANGSFLRPANDQVAGGYIIYGPQTCLVVTFGDGVLKFTLDPQTGMFHPTATGLSIPARTHEFAINASNYHHWHAPIRAFVDDMVTGALSPNGQAFNMRWIASLVAEAHRILTRGGVFLYPADLRKGYEQGRLRFVYECAPIAFLVTQAGGEATDGIDDLMPQSAETLHQRTPFVFGSASKVARVSAYHDLGESGDAALFGKRGLFRS